MGDGYMYMISQKIFDILELVQHMACFGLG